MAQPLKYAPSTDTALSARDELERLLETLHERGVLTALDGFFGALPEVTGVLLEDLDTPGGRNALSNLAVLSMALTALDPNRMNDLRLSAEQGLAAAHESLKGEPPGLVALLRELNDPDVRRVLHAMLVFLQTFGRHMHRRVE